VHFPVATRCKGGVISILRLVQRRTTSLTELDGEWIVAYIIAEPCIGVKDTACVDVCPVECIHPTRDEPNFGAVAMLFINPMKCIDCGARAPVCPVDAIHDEGDLPERWDRFERMNADYYSKRTAGE
jgi:NAD-dependent dihydropyrimidine dehydrogenase PreA subunit